MDKFTKAVQAAMAAINDELARIKAEQLEKLANLDKQEEATRRDIESASAEMDAAVAVNDIDRFAKASCNKTLAEDRIGYIDAMRSKARTTYPVSSENEARLWAAYKDKAAALIADNAERCKRILSDLLTVIDESTNAQREWRSLFQSWAVVSPGGPDGFKSHLAVPEIIEKAQNIVALVDNTGLNKLIR